MEIAARRLHPKVSDDQWRRLGYIAFSSQASSNDLAANPAPPPGPPAVHPMFQYGSSNRNLIWSQHSPRSFQPIYDALEPTLSLATAILLSPASLVFFYSVLYSPRNPAANPSQHMGQPCYVIRRPHPLPDEKTIRDRVLSALEKFADFNAFLLVDENDYPGIQRSHGVTNPTTSLFIDGICITDDNKRGLPTRIRIHKRFTDKLIGWGVGASGIDRLVVLNTQFMVANTICHEIVHAVNYAVDTALLEQVKTSAPDIHSNEPFWEDQRLAELGAAWESEVYGGKIRQNSLDPKCDDPLFVCKWPGTGNIEGLPQAKGSKTTMTWYFIDLHFIHNIQQRWFWNQSYTHDTTLLHIPKTLGKRYYHIGPEITDIDPTWSPTNSSEGKNSSDTEGYVYRDTEKAAGISASP